MDTHETSNNTPTMLMMVHDQMQGNTAIEFASAFAKAHGCRLQLLYVIVPSNFEHWLSVGKIIHQESREKAEQIMTSHSILVQEIVGKSPLISILEGNLKDSLLKTLEENPNIMTIMAPAAPEGGKDGYSSLFSDMSDDLDIPMILLPNNPKELAKKTYFEAA